MNKKIIFVWGLMFLAMLGYLWFIEDSLPDRLAVHFDIAGKPNGFQGKADFIKAFYAIVFFMNGLFLVLSWCIRLLPTVLINIPWKNYWFSTEDRKVLAFEKLRSVLGLAGIFVSSLFLFLVQIIYQANATNPFLNIPINGGVFVVGVLSVFFIALSFIITRPPVEY